MAAARDLHLTTPVADIPGVSPTKAGALADLGVRNVGQLIAYLPMRHERLEAESPIAELAAESIVTARGVVTTTRVVTRGARPRFEAVIEDGSGRLDLAFFNQIYLRHKVQPGVEVRVQGKAKKRPAAVGGMQLVNPKLWVLTPDQAGEQPPQDERIRPVYPASGAISSQQIEQIIGRVLDRALPLIEDHLPTPHRASRDLPELRTAYRLMHRPESEAEVAHARRRLVYDEFLLMQLALAMRRSQRERGSAAPVLRCTKAIDQRIRKRFPFTLTPDQDTVIAEITSDLARATPANRLIQGDVGSGKTAVAVYALLLAVASGHQGALMAPTEILAEQHHASIAQLLTGAAVSPTLLTGRLTPKARASVLAGLADGSVPLVVGTHALLTERVAFKSLAVAIIDEQHRFGVHQRAALRTRGVGAPSEGGLVHVPHTLVMTATPIPRTLAMTVMGDLDVSSIAHLPPGRKPVATRLVDASRVGEVWDFVRKRVERGEQVFVVAPTIDGSTDDAPLTDAPGDAAAVTTASAPTGVLQIAESLREGPLKGLSIGVVHGRLAPEDRERVMNAFRAAEISVLVATTVIEVGVDVPNATIMVILQADRFGLAQLHQLRGRVGRGERPSACVAVPSAGVDTTARLTAFVTTPDGFELAERDLEIRGFGSMIGAEQSGLPPFKIADLSRDRALLELARRDAGAWIERSPALGAPEEALVRRRLMKLHGPWLGLADVG